MQYNGIVIHHSACSSINGKGYDFFITNGGDILPSSEQTDPQYIHICLEGDFSKYSSLTSEKKEQLFLLTKMILYLSKTFHFEHDDIFPHTISCPGTHFPWSQLVILPEDRYH